jgi:hypothetical protein
VELTHIYVLYFLVVRREFKSIPISQLLLLKSSLSQPSTFTLLAIDSFDMDSRAETLAEEKELERSASPTPSPSINKEKEDFGDSPTDNEGGSVQGEAANAEEDGGEYPNGTRMAFIVVALLLSVFLVGTLLTVRILRHI